MANKRKHADSFPETSIYNKFSRLSNAGDDSPLSAGNVQSRVDPTYGQRGAFPGLDSADAENDLFYGPASDGLEYLRMVRSEAKTVPNLLVAPISPAVEDRKPCADYSQGYYADGAYTAAPTQPLHSAKDIEAEDIDPQEAYYATLCARFSALTATLQSPSPVVPKTAHLFQSATHATWRYQLLHTEPTMVLLSQLLQDTVMRGLNVLEALLTASNLKKGKRLGAWAWGLLARCRPVGEMGSEEVGILRSLGKRAVWMLRGIVAGREEDEKAEEEADEVSEEEVECNNVMGLGGVQRADQGSLEVEQTEAITEHIQSIDDKPQSSETTSVGLAPGASPLIDASPNSASEAPIQLEPTLEASDVLAQARQRLLSSLPSSSPSTNNSNMYLNGTSNLEIEHIKDGQMPIDPEAKSKEKTKDTILQIYATLDTIVTVVGEFYGQRDLLDGRLLWDEM